MFSLGSTLSFDYPKPLHLKTTGKIKFQGRVSKPGTGATEQTSVKKGHQVLVLEARSEESLVGEVVISGFKLNQLMLAPQLSGFLRISPKHIKVNKLENTNCPLSASQKPLDAYHNFSLECILYTNFRFITQIGFCRRLFLFFGLLL